MTCPNCDGAMFLHTEGEKAGRNHCNACGICWPVEESGELEVIEEVEAPKPKRTRKPNGAGN